MSGLFFLLAAVFLLAPLFAHVFQVCPATAFWTYTVPEVSKAKPRKPAIAEQPVAPSPAAITSPVPEHAAVLTSGTAPHEDRTVAPADNGLIIGKIEKPLTNKIHMLLDRQPDQGVAVLRRWLEDT